jgi:hypothetical protein
MKAVSSIESFGYNHMKDWARCKGNITVYFKSVLGYELDLRGSRQGLVAGSCEQGNVSVQI